MTNNVLGGDNSRPLSPFVTIYKPQISSILSILHRISGVFLYIGMILFAWLLFGLTFYPDISNYSCLTSIPFQIMLFCWNLALIYHLLNGIRHLFWDAGYGFELKTMRISGIFVFFASIILTLICWAIALY